MSKNNEALHALRLACLRSMSEKGLNEEELKEANNLFREIIGEALIRRICSRKRLEFDASSSLENVFEAIKREISSIIDWVEEETVKTIKKKRKP